MVALYYRNESEYPQDAEIWTNYSKHSDGIESIPNYLRQVHI
jgi:hypothetical protein